MQDYAHSHSTPVTPSTQVHTRRSVGFNYLIPIGLLLGFVIFLMSYVFKSGNSSVPSVSTTVSATPTAALATAGEMAVTSSPTKPLSPTATETQAPSAAPVAQKTRILVLNGSGTAGVASKMREELRSLGYTAISTDNAEEFTYTDITIQTTTAHRADAATLKEQLTKKHTVGAIETVASASADVIVIVGK